MFNKMKDLVEMKKQADRIKKELDSSIVEVNTVNGVKVVVNGAQNFQSIEIDETLVNRDNKKQLEENILRSINDAIKKSQSLAAQKMRSIMPGLPGM